jgi:hypothetical protein
VGASLLAKAVGQSTSMVADRLHSRAGSLPHLIFIDHKICSPIKKALPSRQRFCFINPLFFFLSFHHIPQRIQFRFAE